MESFRRDRDFEPEDLVVQHVHCEIATSNHIAMDASLDHIEIDDNLLDNPIDEDDEDFDPVYQEIDDNHESKYEPRRMAPPQVRIERKIFPNPQMSSSMISSTNGSEEMLDRPLPFVKNRQSRGDPKLIDPRADARMESPPTSSQHTTPFEILSPKSPHTQYPINSFLPEEVPNSVNPVCPFTLPYGNYTVSALATMPRMKKNNKLQIGDFKPMSHSRHCPGTKDDTSTIPYEHIHAERGILGRIKPPTPPMRRLPSWVSKISFQYFHISYHFLYNCCGCNTFRVEEKLWMLNMPPIVAFLHT